MSTRRSTSHYYTSDPEWESFARKNNFQLSAASPDAPFQLDIPADRAAQAISERAWTESHPLSSVGYSSRYSAILARDGYAIPIKISRSTRVPEDEPLPLLFVTHGGGWVQGTHTSEELWLLWPLYQQFNFTIVSIDYRLAPEHKAPTWVNDCWDVLTTIISQAEALGSRFDRDKIILAGSSAGGGIASSLAQSARDQGIKIHSVIANVPVVCDYRHFPTGDYEFTSYEQSNEALYLAAHEMTAIWDLVAPSPTIGADPKISPLLGDLQNLPPHLVFVAGQDPLRDEGIAYAQKLEKSGGKVQLHVYQGVPHSFSRYWELSATKRFWEDVRQGVKGFLQ